MGPRPQGQSVHLPCFQYNLTQTVLKVQASSLKSSQGLRSFVKSSHDQVRPEFSQVIKSSQASLNTPIDVQAGFFQVKSSLKSSHGEECVTSQVTIKSSQARILVKSSSQVIKSSGLSTPSAPAGGATQPAQFYVSYHHRSYTTQSTGELELNP